MAEGASQTRQIQIGLDRLRAGDASARSVLIQCACERLTLLTRKMLGQFPRVKRWEQTDDVLQNAALRLYGALADMQPESPADFFRLAALTIRRELLDLARHYYGKRGEGANHATWHRDPGASHDAHPVERQAASADDPLMLERWTAFHQQVEALPEEDRQLFDLLWYQGLSQLEAAELLQTSTRTIKRRWRAVRLKIHDALHGALPDC
jgi:RNA polymerase sigma-70 factor (ECF subfamily)